MSNFFKNLFGNQVDLKGIYERGAIILDVRSPEEYRTGHIKGSVNIPLDLLKTKIPDLQKKNRPVITCCRSGARSGMAKTLIASVGLEVYNGGSWDNLEKKIQ